MNEDWTSQGYETAGFYSRWILWNLPSLRASVADTNKRFSNTNSKLKTQRYGFNLLDTNPILEKSSFISLLLPAFLIECGFKLGVKLLLDVKSKIATGSNAFAYRLDCEFFL